MLGNKGPGFLYWEEGDSAWIQPWQKNWREHACESDSDGLESMYRAAKGRTDGPAVD